jgi:hypothetical protein
VLCGQHHWPQSFTDTPEEKLPAKGPQAAFAYYYLNVPEFVRTNLTLRLAIAPAYSDGELGIRDVLSPSTDIGIGIAGVLSVIIT